MKKWTIICFLAYAICSNAQIGYQVALLNKATGEPRSGVTVNATVKIEDSKGGIIFQGTQAATSNDFGILSLTVGDANLFKNVDFGKMPFFISVTVDGTLIGKSQILSVPIAEAAKTIIPEITEEELVGTWKTDGVWDSSDKVLTFLPGGKVSYGEVNYDNEYVERANGVYEIQGRFICFIRKEYSENRELSIGRLINGHLFFTGIETGINGFVKIK